MATESFAKLDAVARGNILREIAGTLLQVAAAAKGPAPVILFGPRGAGTNFLARLIHETSTRAATPFVAVQCGLYPQRTLDAQFFGRASSTRCYIRTAHAQSQGRIAAAAQGTLFIDQIQNASARIQIEMVRLLRDRQYHDCTENVVRHADVRIIVSARPDLEARAKIGRFDAQLFKQLSARSIFISRSCTEPEMILGAIEFLRNDLETDGPAQYPPDVISLRDAIRRAAAAESEGLPTHRLLNAVIAQLHVTTPSNSAAVGGWTADEVAACAAGTFDQIAQRVQQVLIEQTLARCNGIQAMAADLLGLSRITLATKMVELGLATPALNAA